MTAITHQRIENTDKILALALQLYDRADDTEKRRLFTSYVFHVAHNYTIQKQRELIEILEARVAAIKEVCG